jgi:Leucine-rich repeat (LRR) protein
VFYDVQPCQVGGTHREPYAKAFQDHQGKGKDVTEWKEALKKASKISGIVFQTDKSNYGEFLNEIGQLVLKYVKPEPFKVARHPVGLGQALEALENEIQRQSATKLVGISGIGGAGKSTLAKHFFNLRGWTFNRFCYLSNVGERKANLTILQQQLVRALHGNDIDIPDTEIGKTILRNRVKGFRILIVLDDVDEREQIERLLDIHAVEPGSVILVTCRDKNILKGYNPLWYDLQPLQRMHARELFCRHALLESESLEGYEDLVEEFLDICGGLPFCLEIWGEKLAGNRDRRYWKQQLKRFSQGEPLADANRVTKTLRMNYESMDSNEEKELFLDIGCFFVGEDIELVVRVSEGLGYYSDVQNHLLENLRKKCFVHFECDAESHHEIESSGKDLNPEGNGYLIQTLCKSHDGHKYVESYLPAVLPQRRSKVLMLSPVRELARHIVREDSRSRKTPLRLSCSIDIEKMLDQDGSESRRIRGILIPIGQNPPQLTNTIKGVRLLVVEHPIDLSAFFGSAIKLGDLVWLRLRDFGCISIPPNISMRCLRVLQFQGPSHHLEFFFKHLTISEHKIPTKLRELSIDVEGGASASTSSSRQLVDLQHSMESSHGNISSTHDSVMPYFHRFLGRIGIECKDLKKIVLKNIPLLKSLLIVFSDLGNLMHLDLSGSTNLTEFDTLPIDFSNLRNLRHLDLSGSTNLTELPTSFSRLLQLQHLALRDCEKLSIPPNILGKIATLEYIDFKGCAQLKHLPEGIASQTCLRYLNLLYTNLQELPLNLQLLDKLEHLRIGSPDLKTLPDSVASLKGLKELILLNCLELNYITPIEELKLLERLDIYESKVNISPRWKNVKVLTIYRSPITEFSFPTQDVMDALRDFTLGKTSISNICFPEDIFPRLEEVDLSYSLQLKQVQRFPQTLVRLTLEGCAQLEKLTNLSDLVHLRFLNIKGCTKLETLNVEGLTSLEELSADRCWKLRSMEAFSQLERLNFLGVSTHMHGRDFSNASGFEKLMKDIGISFELTVLDVSVKTTVKTPVILNNVLSHSAILMCFLTDRVSGNGFRVCFEPSNNRAIYKEYKTFCEHDSQGRMLHMYMWTEDSKLFKDENLHNKVEVYGNGSGNELEEKGWIVALASKSQVLEVCKQIMREGGVEGDSEIFERMEII